MTMALARIEKFVGEPIYIAAMFMLTVYCHAEAVILVSYYIYMACFGAISAWGEQETAMTC